MQIKRLLAAKAAENPEKTAIVFSGDKISFSLLQGKSASVGGYLKNKKLGKGAKVAFYLPNTPFFAYSLLGALSEGFAVVPLDFMSTQEEIINFLNHSRAKILFLKPKKEIAAEIIKQRCPELVEIIECDGSEGLLLEKKSYCREEEDSGLDIDQGRLASIFYTSGATGRPKGVMLNFSHFDNPVECIDYHLDLSARDINICAGLPFSHIGGFDAILLMLWYGSALVLMERFHPYQLLKNISRHKPTLLWLVPSMYIAVLSLKDYSSFDLSSLRYLVVFGAPSSPALMKKVHKIFPNTYLLNGWGMTETAAPNCVLPPGSEKIESAGKFAPGMETKITDENQNLCDCGQQGQLWVKGDAVMSGYYREPELTRRVLKEDGWFNTGDVARFDKDGLCYIVGRTKDMIKAAGEVVNSAEVEEKISLCPAVKEAAVIGVFDKLRGEVPKAFVVRGAGRKLSAAELAEFLKKYLSHFKIPHYFEFVERLPKNRIGKIDKIKLKEAEGKR